MSGNTQNANLLYLFEEVSSKNRALQLAVHDGDDALVSALDREIHPLITEMVNHKASDPDQIYLQLSLLTRLLREDADDRSCVLRHASMLAILVERYFGGHLSQAPVEVAPAFARDVVADLAEDEHLNEVILENMPDRVAVLTRDYRYIFANPAMAAMLDMREMDLIGRSVFDCCLAEDNATQMRASLDHALSGASGTLTSSFCRLDGSLIELKGRYAPLKAKLGAINGVVLTYSDIVSASGGVIA